MASEREQRMSQAIVAEMKKGRRFMLATYARATLYSKPEHVKLGADGTLRVVQGRSWVRVGLGLDGVAQQLGVYEPHPFEVPPACARCHTHTPDLVADERAGNTVCQSCYWAQESERNEVPR